MCHSERERERKTLTHKTIERRWARERETEWSVCDRCGPFARFDVTFLDLVTHLGLGVLVRVLHLDVVLLDSKECVLVSSKSFTNNASQEPFLHTCSCHYLHFCTSKASTFVLVKQGAPGRHKTRWFLARSSRLTYQALPFCSWQWEQHGKCR